MKALYTIFLVLFLAAFTNSVSAENKAKDIRLLKTELSLTAQQMQQLNSIYNNTQARVRLQAPVTNWKQKAEQKMQIRKQQQQQVMNILTKEQRKQYRKIMGMQPKKKVDQ
jgi:DNA-binding transcriptional regulator YbjK